MDLLSGCRHERKSHDGARSAPLIPPTEVFADLRDPGSVRTAGTLPVVGSPINLAADTDRIGTRLTSDNVVSDADHLLATHSWLNRNRNVQAASASARAQ